MTWQTIERWKRYSTEVRAALRAGLLAALIAASASAIAVSDYRYQTQALRLAEAVKDILVLHGLCETRDQCSSRQIVFVTPESWGLAVELYGLGNEEVLQQIFSASSSAFLKLPDDASVEIRVYGVSKTEALSASVFRKPRQKMQLRWENRNADR